MFKTKGGAGGQRLFEQCSKKLRIWRKLAPLMLIIIDIMDNMMIASSPFFCSFSFLQVLTLKQWLYLEILTTFSPSNHLRTGRPLVYLQIASSLKGEKRPIFNLSLYIISYIGTSSSSGKYFISTPNHIKPSCTGRKNGSMSPFWPAFALYQSAGTQTGDYHHYDDLLWSHTF